jgi:hypothetical protein
MSGKDHEDWRARLEEKLPPDFRGVALLNTRRAEFIRAPTKEAAYNLAREKWGGKSLPKLRMLVR